MIMLLAFLTPLSFNLIKASNVHKIYLLYLANDADFIDITPSIKDMLIQRFENNDLVTVITDMDSYREVLTNASQGDIIVNLHGSVIPLPPPYTSLGSSGAFKFIKDLALNISRRGFAFINIAGLPFKYASNKREHIFIELNEEGIIQFFKVLNYTVKVDGFIKSAGGLDYASITVDGINASKLSDISLPTRVSAIYSISTNLAPLFTLYATDVVGYLRPFETVAAYPLGKGFYIHVGMWYESDNIKIDVVIASLVYLTKLAELTPEVYIIALNDTAWYGVNPYVSLQYLKERLNMLNISYYIVDSNKALYELIMSDMRNVVVINLHGSVIPIPEEYLTSSENTKTSVYEYIVDLARCVRDKGWIYVNVAGYPFSIVACGKSQFWYVTNTAGLSTFLAAASNFTVGGYCWDGLSDRPLGAILTDDGIMTVRELNLKPWEVWGAIIAQYSLNTSAPCLTSLYDTFLLISDRKYRAVASLRYGQGIFAFIGLGQQVPDSVKASLGFLLISIVKPKKLTICVSDSELKPIGTVEVSITVGNTEIEKGYTNESGIFSTFLSGGIYTIALFHEGFSPLTLQYRLLTLPGNLNVTLEPIQLKIRAIDILTQDPVVNATVTIVDAYGNNVSSMLTDSQGYAIFNLPSGSYYVVIQATGYTQYKSSLIELSSTTYLEVPLRRSFKGLYIRVIDANSRRPLSSMSVKVFEDESLIYEGITNEDGLITVNLANSSTLRVEVYDGNMLVGMSAFTASNLMSSMIVEIPVFKDVKYKSLYQKEVQLYKSLKREYESLLSKYNSLHKKYNSLSDKYSELSKSYSKLKESFLELEDRYLEINKAYFILNRTFNELMVNYTEMLESFENLNNEYKSLEVNFTKLNDMYIQLASNYTVLEDQFNELKAWNATLTTKYNELLEVKNKYESLKRTWPLVSLAIAILSMVIGTALGYAYGKRRGEYLVINP